MAVTFESYERRIDQIKPVMEKYGIKDFEDALKICPSCVFKAYWLYSFYYFIRIKSFICAYF